MPALYIALHTRDNSSTPSASSQMISADGGIDNKTNIIAMISALSLFILVLILYQYISLVMTRRSARTRPRPVPMRSKSRSDMTFPSRLAGRFRGLFVFFRRAIRPLSGATSNVSNTGSTEGLVRTSPYRPAGARLPLSLPCTGRSKAYPKSRTEAKRPLRPLFLNKDPKGAPPRPPRAPIDEKTLEFLRSPRAFAELPSSDHMTAFERSQNESEHRRAKHHGAWFDEPARTPGRLPVVYTSPLSVHKKTEMQGREGPAVNLRMPLSPPAPSPTLTRRTSSLSIIDEKNSPHRSFFDTDDEDNVRKKKFCFKFPLPHSKKPREEDAFTIGEFSDWDAESNNGR
ncbi:hypothetical protein DFH11DRAFT_1726790 [Phellopilus nigrolimitatus]|nr:hypothetical protein DFH11DRAFT_1726790 [Phellopilus nigrolimitatus]